MPKKISLFELVYQIEGLKKAWDQIFENGIKSSSPGTKSSVQTFKLDEHKALYRIRKELRKSEFAFDGIKGIGVRKSKGKNSPRPIVLSPPSVRIVQRRILDVLQSKPPIKTFLDVPSSFGAIKKKGVPDAIKATVAAIKNGASHYLKSDIASFFTKIPRPRVLDVIAGVFPGEDKFIELVDKATNLEVQNLADLEKKYGEAFKTLFIFDDVGTPQGCCLSPLFGNILLYDFDREINGGDIVCLRYLDDFIIFGPNLRAVNAAFFRAQTILTPLGLTAYDPAKDTAKASRGSVDNFEFLGVEFQGKNIRPASKARKKLLDGIDDIIRESINVDFSQISNGSEEDRSLVKTLYLIHNKVKGWGNQYYFCNDKALWGSLDVEIDRRIKTYLGQHFAKTRTFDRFQKRRQLGVHLLIDSKAEPITW
jgi:hypothetical protein